MHIFKEGRSIYLEFLRNLTPQIILLSFSLLAARDLQLTHWSFDNLKKLVMACCFFFIWIIATWANISLFIEKYLTSEDRINRASRHFARLRFTGFKFLLALFLFAKNNKKPLLSEIIIPLLVSEFCLVMVILAAVISAANSIKLLQS